ncbi:hypothetical protein HZB01_00635 [Candidatus Woesearchaeota archaeon]|nr:hypothetical protein [Candidatus Woesearchaeota archaeon]
MNLLLGTMIIFIKSAFSTSVFTSGSMENAGLKKIGPSEARMPPVY